MRAMNLSELKQLPIADLVNIAQEMGVDNLSHMRKQDIIFAILKTHALKGEDIYGNGVVQIISDGGFAFLLLLMVHTWLGRMIFTFLLVRLDGLVCVLVIPFLVKLDHLKIMSVILRYLRLMKLITTPQKMRSVRFFLKT